VTQQPPPPPPPEQQPPFGGYPPNQYGAPPYGGFVPPDHHQAVTVLILGILGLVLCQLISPFAWVMGNRVVGEIELTGDALDLAGDGLTMIAYSAEPGSQAEDQLKLLATWSATVRPRASQTAGTSPPSAGPGSALAGNRPAGSADVGTG